MTQRREYHRPQDLAAALALLQRPDVRTVPLAGGSWLVPRLRPDLADSIGDSVDAVVDLADLGLDYVSIQREAEGGAWLRLGATATLSAVIESPLCRELAGGLLVEAARREGPVNLRNTATVAGCIMRADPESELLLALVALAAHVIVFAGSERAVPLLELLAHPVVDHGLITEIRIPWPATAVGGDLARVARTPSDRPIVAAAAVAGHEAVRVAIGGVTAQPLLLHLDQPEDLAQAVAAVLEGREILADFRGSAEYRRAMAPIVARRALDAALAV